MFCYLKYRNSYISSQTFDLHQGSNATYLQAQLFRLFFAGLSQLTPQETFADVLNATNFVRIQPIDSLTNSLVSPLFYGIQSTGVSDAQGRVTLSGVRVARNLPGSWTLQCGVDGVMMQNSV